LLPLQPLREKNNRKGNTKFFARPVGIIRAGKDLKEL
jgi:hypothetical protein